MLDFQGVVPTMPVISLKDQRTKILQCFSLVLKFLIFFLLFVHVPHSFLQFVWRWKNFFLERDFLVFFWKIFLKSVWKLNRNIDFERTAHRFCVDLKCRFWGFLTIPTKPNFLPHIFSPVWMTLMYAFHFFCGTDVFWDAVWLRLLEMRMDQIKERLTII